MNNNVVIYGAGGQGKVIADILEKSQTNIIGFIDDDENKKGQTFYNYSVIGTINHLQVTTANYTGMFIAIGNNRIREEKFFNALNLGYIMVNAIHSSAVYSRTVKLGKGICIMAGAIINPDAQISDGVIINTCSTVDHDCVLESFTQISPGANLAGGVRIKSRAFIGTGAIIIPGVTIGKDAIVGAGSVVIHDIPDFTTAVGNPARVIKQNDEKTN